MEKAQNEWFSLDNSAKIYPMMASAGKQYMYRLNYVLNENVDVRKLNDAVNLTLDRFPSFKVCLKRGLFWCYLDYNSKTFSIEEDDGIVLKHFRHFTNRNKYLFRVMIFQNKISFEFLHMLSDGKGSITFANAVVYNYLKSIHDEIEPEDKILTGDVPYTSNETEDSFVKNKKHGKKNKLNIKEFKGSPAFTIKGKKLKDPAGMKIITAKTSVDSILTLSKSYGVSMTVFLTALLLWSIQNTSNSGQKLNKDLLCYIPIDLRRFYGSQTLRNFVLFARVGVRTRTDKYDSFEDFLQAVQRDLSNGSQKEAVDEKLNIALRLQNILPYKLLPLQIKYFLFNVSNWFMKTNQHTTVLSNLGNVAFPASMQKYLSDFYVTCNTFAKMPVSLGVNSYNKELYMVFSEQIEETEIEKFFFRYLTEKGIKITISSNVL